MANLKILFKLGCVIFIGVVVQQKSLSAEQVEVEEYSFLDVKFRVKPFENFCGLPKCHITYKTALLKMQNEFDLKTITSHDGEMSRIFDHSLNKYFLEGDTVIKLSNDLAREKNKIYLGTILFDVPEDVKEYILIDISDLVKGLKQKTHRHVLVHPFNTSTGNWKGLSYKVDVMKRSVVQGSATNRGAQEVKDIRNNVTSNIGRFNSANKICTCIKRNCGCCEHMIVPKIRLDHEVCVNISYISEDIGLKLSLSFDNYSFISEEISVRNPPPVCFDIPHLREYASLCMRLYQMDVNKTRVKGCMDVEAELAHLRIARFKIGCFEIPI